MTNPPKTPSMPQSDIREILDNLTCSHHVLPVDGCIGCDPAQAIEQLINAAVIAELEALKKQAKTYARKLITDTSSSTDTTKTIWAVPEKVIKNRLSKYKGRD